MSFETLGLGPNLLRSIEEVGYTDPTPIQQAAIPLIIEGSDLIGIAQTGTGKTAAFTLPMLETLERLTKDPARRGKTRALVLSPTRELVVQIHENVNLLTSKMTPYCGHYFRKHPGCHGNPERHCSKLIMDTLNTKS